MKKRFFVIGLVFLFVFSSVIPISIGYDVKISNTKESLVFSNGNTLYVGGSGPNNYTKIQDAIDNASNDDTVFVYDDSSPYYGHININKSISLIGEDKNTTIIEEKKIGTAIYITADKVLITGFTIQLSEEGNNYQGISIGSNDNKIINNIIKNNPDGIHIFRDHINNLIQGNDIVYNGFGIFFDDCEDTIVTGNFIAHNMGCGIFDRGGGSSTITWNVIADNGKLSNAAFGRGTLLIDSGDNYHHNDFLLNLINAETEDYVNSWDDGLEGNF